MDTMASTRFSSADISVLKQLLLFSVAMFALPLSVFFILKNVLLKDWIVLPVIASVITVHIVIGVYVWMAIKERGGDEEQVPLKED